MSQISPYLTFNGNCEEAFNYYKSVFGGEFSGIMRFNDAPPMPGHEIDPKYGNLIMNMTLPISKEVFLRGSDGHPNYGKVPFGKNVTLSVEVESKEKADKIFTALAKDGIVAMPIADVFWGSYFGMTEDQFGINWMVSFEYPKK